MRGFLIGSLMVLAMGCDGDDGPPDAPGSTACVGSPSGGCEQVVDDLAQCPSWQQVCPTGCGGASYDCCYCGRGTDGTYAWQTEYIECFPCIDAGVDAP